MPPCPALRNTKEKAEGYCILHQRLSQAPATCIKFNTFIFAAYGLVVLQYRGQTWHNKTNIYFISGGTFLSPISSCHSQPPPGCDKGAQLLEILPHDELSDFRIQFLVTVPLAVTTSVSSDNSSFLLGHIKLLQGRLFYVLFLMPLCTGFMSKKIICHFQFLQHYSDKNQSLRKSLMSEVSSKQSNKYCSS